jgi:hypothetical protein
MSDEQQPAAASERPFAVKVDPPKPEPESPPRVHTDGSSAGDRDGHETGGGHDGAGGGPTGS